MAPASHHSCETTTGPVSHLLPPYTQLTTVMLVLRKWEWTEETATHTPHPLHLARARRASHRRHPTCTQIHFPSTESSPRWKRTVVSLTEKQNQKTLPRLHSALSSCPVGPGRTLLGRPSRCRFPSLSKLLQSGSGSHCPPHPPITVPKPLTHMAPLPL